MKDRRASSAQFDLSYLKAGVEQLEDYLLSQEIYQAIGISASIGEMPYPQLTLGNLLLAAKRVQATLYDRSEHIEWNHLSQKLVDSRSRWQVAWRKKASAEYRQRLNLWGQFLEEYDKEPEANYDRYGYEVRRRVILEILSDEIENTNETEQEKLSNLDRFLESVFVAGDFIWDSKLLSSFPRSPYWYLYGRIKNRFLRGENPVML